jgi:hypothetical protein
MNRIPRTIRTTTIIGKREARGSPIDLKHARPRTSLK